MPGIINDPRLFQNLPLNVQSNARQVAEFNRKSAMLPRKLVQTPLGPEKPSTAPVPRGVGDNVRAMQQFLKNRGYNIAVDGIRGPETNAAVLAFHKGVAPQVYNKKGKGPGKTPPPPPSPGPPPVTPKPPKNTPTPPAAPDTSGVDQLLDPAAYASGMVNAQYDPQINELIRQITQGRADASSHTKQIQDWYKQVMDVAGQGAQFDAQAAQDAQQGYNDAGQNVLNLFGGPEANQSTAAEAAGFHDSALGNLVADAQANAAFDKNIKSIEAVQGAETQKSQFNADQQALKALADNLVQLRGAKGQAYSSAYQTGVQNRTQQEAAQQQLKLAQELAPSQVATAQANAATAKANASTAAASAKANLAIAQAKLKQANAQTAAVLASGNGKWNLTLPAQQGALQKAFETNVYGPRGGLSLQPDVAWANLQQQLQMNGLANDPHAQAIARGTFLQGLHTSHSLGNFGGWAWNGTKVVRTGNKYVVDKKTGKRSLVNSKGKVIPDYKPKS